MCGASTVDRSPRWGDLCSGLRPVRPLPVYRWQVLTRLAAGASLNRSYRGQVAPLGQLVIGAYRARKAKRGQYRRLVTNHDWVSGHSRPVRPEPVYRWQVLARLAAGASRSGCTEDRSPAWVTCVRGIRHTKPLTCQYRGPFVCGRAVFGAAGCTEGRLLKGNVLFGALSAVRRGPL